MNLNYVSTFSGAGGLDLGLERAGLKPVSFCEIERDFCNSLLSNQGWEHCDGNFYFGDAPIINADIREVSTSELLVGKKPVDLVVGGAPCQAFSSSGKQLSVLDPRGALVDEFARVIDEIKPKMFLFENVRGIITSRDRSGVPGGVITGLINRFEDTGYSVRACLLNAADYGSFQRRVRCFLIASSNGLAPDIPPFTHTKNGDLLLPKWRSLREFLELHSDRNKGDFGFPTAALGKQLSVLPDGSGLKSPGRKEPTRPGGHWGYRQGTFISDLELPARTITGSSSQDWIRWDSLLRRLTISEISQLQGFPADWIFEGTKSGKFRQIGNAVPVIFGEKLGEIVVEHLKNFPNNQKAEKLGVPKSFKGYISYVERDSARNRSARRVHQQFES